MFNNVGLASINAPPSIHQSLSGPSPESQWPESPPQDVLVRSTTGSKAVLGNSASEFLAQAVFRSCGGLLQLCSGAGMFVIVWVCGNVKSTVLWSHMLYIQQAFVFDNLSDVIATVNSYSIRCA